MNWRELYVDEFLSPCVHGLRLAAEEAHVKLTLDIGADLPAVRGDIVKLRQVFINLISNSIKFTPENGVVVVSAKRTTTGRVRLSVRDTGVGMSDDEVLVAVTPFGQVDGGKNRWREGTGLGLPIARALVQMHGGSFDIRSEKSKGTEIVIVLPEVRAEPIAIGDA